jgi:hypothetical protein
MSSSAIPKTYGHIKDAAIRLIAIKNILYSNQSVPKAPSPRPASFP